MYKIHVQNKPLFLIDKVDGEVEDYLHRPDTIFIDELNSSAINTVIQQMQTPDIYAGVFLYHDLKALLNAFKAQFSLIVASGGLVHFKSADILLIFRKGKWDLPKGKLDDGEELEACAMREIAEETGATGLTLVRPLHITYHTYYEKENHILKESHWYLINAKTKSPLKPQTEEDIEKCEWVNIKELPVYMNNMHASIVDVINLGVTLLKKKA